ncbi:MAG: DNA-binding protein [Gammaproteobacteria bacterium]|nr:MAG: DNA-binding protein [Gammaproteobacteria bacterium]
MITNNRLEAEQAAKYIGVAVGTLAVWRSTKRHTIPYYKLSKIIYYDIIDLDTFI